MNTTQGTPDRGPTLDIREGAVAMIDALGFRGIWQRYSELEVVSKLQKLADVTAAEANDLQGAARNHGGNVLEYVRPTFLSDTVVFAVATKSLIDVTKGLDEEGWGELIEFDESSLAGEAVRIAAELVAVLMRRALESPVPLAYRGAISFGRFGMTDRFVIGPAIDDAATWMNKAQGAFVMLTPSAVRFPQPEIPSSISNLVSYAVPLKCGQKDGCLRPTHDTLVVSPIAGVDEESSRAAIVAQLIESFGSSPNDDVAEKLLLTRQFLDAADRAEKAALAELLAQAMRP